MSASKRLKPPPTAELDVIRSRNEDVTGVGNAGIAGRREEFALAKGLEMGVPGDASEYSSILEMDKFLVFMFFRELDEKFFRSVGGREGTGDDDRFSGS